MSVKDYVTLLGPVCLEPEVTDTQAVYPLFYKLNNNYINSTEPYRYPFGIVFKRDFTLLITLLTS